MESSKLTTQYEEQITIQDGTPTPKEGELVMTKTALDLTKEERRVYRLSEIFGRREKEKSGEISIRKREAWEVARRAAEILRKKFGAGKVVVFGSLAHDKEFGPWSDIDLAAWGIPPELFYSAVGAVTGLSPYFKIDLVDVGDCRPTLRTAIVHEGIEI